MADTEKTKILIVDDLPEKLLVYRAVLEELGQELVTAGSGAEALREVLRHDFAVILLDVNMPGMDGFETAALIRGRKKSAYTPIIFITAFADDVRAARGYAHGAVDYILAPVVPEILRAKVQVFVDLFRMTQQVKRQADQRIALAEEKTKREAAEDSNRRLAFLARACEVLGHSLDRQVTARDLARLPVPFLADLAAVALPERPGEAGKLFVARTEGGQAARLVPDVPACLPGELAAAVGRVLGGGPAEFFPEPPGASAEPATTALVLPVCARGQVCAVLALSREASGRRFGPAELSMAETLASRAEDALDNARLYQDVQRADRQKNEFLSMLAHELRNPLAPISNAVQVLCLEGSGPSEVCWARDVISRQVKHLARLVDDLLDVSRITQGKIRLSRAPVELAAVVAEAVEASAPVVKARRHRLDVALPREPLWVEGDAARLAQVLTNLLNNAAKYTDEGGRIWLSAEHQSREHQRPDDSRERPEVVLRVRDTGIGIPPEMLSTVFNLFTQAERSLDRSQGGLGIGLTLVKSLVEMHGGSVQVHSDGAGRGSEFVVRLPLFQRDEGGGMRDEERPGGACLPSSLIPPPSSLLRRVLVVDDNGDSAESFALLLRLGGCDVRLAHDGPAALRAAEAFRPEVVLLDIGLPEMDGYEVARRLRARPATRGAVLVAVTGYGRDEDRRRSREAGFDRHLVKPVDPGALLEMLAAVPAPAAAEPSPNGQPAAGAR